MLLIKGLLTKVWAGFRKTKKRQGRVLGLAVREAFISKA